MQGVSLFLQRLSTPEPFCRGDQLLEVLLRVAIILLPRASQSLLGEAQGARPLLGGEHRLGGAALVFEFRRHALDEALENALGGIEVALARLDLGAAQLVIVQPPALVLVAIRLLPLAEERQSSVAVATGQSVLGELV